MMARSLGLWAALVLAGCTAGCSGGRVDTVHLSLSADDRLNPDPRGNANPAQVRIFLLKAPERLNNADYFQLAEKEAAVLGDTLDAREQVTMHPGESRIIDLRVPPDARWIGITVGYRDIDHATWRTTTPVARALNVSIGSNRVATSVPK